MGRPDKGYILGDMFDEIFSDYPEILQIIWREDGASTPELRIKHPIEEIRYRGGARSEIKDAPEGLQELWPDICATLLMECPRGGKLEEDRIDEINVVNKDDGFEFHDRYCEFKKDIRVLLEQIRLAYEDPDKDLIVWSLFMSYEDIADISDLSAEDLKEAERRLEHTREHMKEMKEKWGEDYSVENILKESKEYRTKIKKGS